MTAYNSFQGAPGALILVVEDNRVNRLVLEHTLRKEGLTNLVLAESVAEARGALRQSRPDLVFLDLHMPGVDGFTFLAEIRATQPPEEYLPIVVLTADITDDSRRRALTLGATDFLTKPFDRVEVVLRARNLLAARAAHISLQHERDLLEERVAQRTRGLEMAQAEILDRFALVADFRDDDTGDHTRRVGTYSAVLARRMGYGPNDAELIRLAAPLHDIGKIGIRDHILLKPARLTAEEFAIMRRHTEIGAQILSGSNFPVLQLAEQIARTHHEWWNGGGYIGLRAEQIPVGSLIVSVADVFDALMHERPYKEPWPLDRTIGYIRDGAGTQFSPAVVEAFVEAVLAGELEARDDLRPDTHILPAFATQCESQLLLPVPGAREAA